MNVGHGSTLVNVWRLTFAAALVAMGVGSAGSVPKDSPVSAKIRALYAGFDPRKEPLEVEMIKEWDEGDIHIEQLYFTGQIFDDVKTRVYAYRGAPRVGTCLPGILYCHGGGQTAYLEWVRFWARQGYVCVSFDFSGDTNKNGLPEYKREHFTRWGPTVEKMMAGPNSSPGADPLKCEFWYQVCLTAQCSLTLLESHARVNPEELGAYGVSAGGYLCWFLAATDKRVKTIVPIYGAGAAFRDANGMRPEQITPDVARAKFLKSPGNPEFYAPLVDCPVLYLTATNDGAFNLDYSMDTVDGLGSKVVRLLYTPRFNHHIEPPESRSLPLWMDWQLRGNGGPWPETPLVEITSAGEVPQVRVVPDNTSLIEKVDVYYCLNNVWALSRFWRDARNARRDGDAYIAETPFLRPGDRIYAFANITYHSGRKVSSRIVDVATAQLSGVKPTLRRESLVDTMETSNHWHWIPAYPDPKLYESYLEPWSGPAGERRFTVRPFDCDNPPFVMKDGTVKFNFGTRKISDPQWQGGAADKALLIDYYSPRAPRELTVSLGTGVLRQAQPSYSAQPAVVSDQPGWVTLRLELSGLKDSEGNALSKWDNVQSIGLSGLASVDKTPVFRNLRWDR